METQITDRLELAAHFVNTTNNPIFLTGKAGTGKTTFLRNLTHMTHKSHIIVAPTGIAALHAKGVTIHSQFLLPFGSFLPTREPEGNFTNNANFFTQFTLGRRHSLNMVRKKVLKSCELLIIDEVSMLRADILDAIDFRMKSVKRNFSEPFGGAQVLMIGDLFQLPPIVRENEWQVLSKFYKSMHFFEAHALRQSGMVYLELDKIFRQKDDTFINILNNLRDNQTTLEDINHLNKHFKTSEEIRKLKDTIIITTHNNKAEEHNRKELAAIKAPSHYFEATISKDFQETLYPLPKTLELKEGAQIMFIKNDASGNSDFFNGKMAKVKEIKGDEITVVMADSKFDFKLSKSVWENKKYMLNEETKELEEEVIGTFEQYPIKLAWSVTVHKSQGLTFDKAVIDVGQAFASGQVYVALSRLRSLDGLTLGTRINPGIINNDPDVVSFTKSVAEVQEPLENLLKTHQKTYVQKLLIRTFDFSDILHTIEAFLKAQDSSLEFDDPEMQIAMHQLHEGIAAESDNSKAFQRQLINLLHQSEFDKLLERLEKGSAYYSRLMQQSLKKLFVHAAEVELFSRTKKYLESLSEIELLLFKKFEEIKRVVLLIPAIANGETIEKMDKITSEIAKIRQELYSEAKTAARTNEKFSKSKSGKKKKEKGEPKIKLAKGETYEITYEMSEAGRTISEIVKERGLAESTIRGHLAKGIALGMVDIHQHLDKAKIKEIAQIIKKKDGDLGAIRQEYPVLYDYGTLKMVAAYLEAEK